MVNYWKSKIKFTGTKENNKGNKMNGLWCKFKATPIWKLSSTEYLHWLRLNSEVLFVRKFWMLVLNHLPFLCRSRCAGVPLDGLLSLESQVAVVCFPSSAWWASYGCDRGLTIVVQFLMILSSSFNIASLFWNCKPPGASAGAKIF